MALSSPDLATASTSPTGEEHSPASATTTTANDHSPAAHVSTNAETSTSESKEDGDLAASPTARDAHDKDETCQSSSQPAENDDRTLTEEEPKTSLSEPPPELQQQQSNTYSDNTTITDNSSSSPSLSKPEVEPTKENKDTDLIENSQTHTASSEHELVSELSKEQNSKNLIIQDTPSHVQESEPNKLLRSGSMATTTTTSVLTENDNETDTEAEAKDHLINTLRNQISDLHSQVSNLNAKLVGSFGKIGDLEDELFQCKTEITQKTEQVNNLESERKAWDDSVEGGLYVEKAHVQSELARMMDRVLSETTLRQTAESDKALIERELDDLSASLFAEANAMVSTERRARHAADQKSKSLEERLKDTEMLMAAQSVQLRDLGTKLEEAERERDHYKATVDALQELAAAQSAPGSSDSEAQTPTTANSTLNNSDTLSVLTSKGDGSLTSTKSTDEEKLGTHVPFRPSKSPRRYGGSGSASNATLTPSATNLQHSHLVLPHENIVFDLNGPLPTLMLHTVPYKEFVSFIEHLRNLRNQTLINVMNSQFSSSASTSPSFLTNSQQQDSSTYVAEASSNGFVSATPSQQPTEEQLNQLHALVPLTVHNSHPFMKRCIEEDSDPTVRLDFAPGLKWLSRRDVGRAILDGSLIIEPAFGHTFFGHVKCALCGVPVSPGKDVSNGPISSNDTASVVQDTSDRSATDIAKQSVRKWVGGVSNWRSNLGAFNTSSRNSIGHSHSASASSQNVTDCEDKTLPVVSHSATTVEATDRTNEQLPAVTEHSRSISNPLPPDHSRKSSSSSDQLKSTQHHNQIYVFKSGETHTPYPLCQPYCLSRLRAVCEFWTFVRAVERALLLNERFGPTHNLQANASSSKKSSTGLSKGLGGLFRLTSSPTPSVTTQEDERTMFVKKKFEEAAAQLEAANSNAADESDSAKSQTAEGKKSEDRVSAPEREETAANISTDTTDNDTTLKVEDDQKDDVADANSNTQTKVQEKTPETSTNEEDIEVDSKAILSTHSSTEEDVDDSANGQGETNAALDDDETSKTLVSSDSKPADSTPALTGKHSRVASSELHIQSSNTIIPTHEWEKQCWNELAKLKLVMYWTRNGAELPTHDISAATALGRLPPHPYESKI